MWLLDHPEAKGSVGITDERFTGKLGWVREFSEEIWSVHPALQAGLGKQKPFRLG